MCIYIHMYIPLRKSREPILAPISRQQFFPSLHRARADTRHERRRTKRHKHAIFARARLCVVAHNFVLLCASTHIAIVY